MMQDPPMLIALASSSVLALGITSFAVLKGWHGWLDLKRAQFSHSRPEPAAPTTARIEVSDLQDRVRKLEAIVNGTDH